MRNRLMRLLSVRACPDSSLETAALFSAAEELDWTTVEQDSTVRCGSAQELVDRAAGCAAEADTKMDQLSEATRNIDRSSAQIVTIIKDIEDIAFQTNILALNALGPCGHLVRAGVHLPGHLGDIPDHPDQVGVDGLEAPEQVPEVADVVVLVGHHVHSQIAGCTNTSRTGAGSSWFGTAPRRSTDPSLQCGWWWASCARPWPPRLTQAAADPVGGLSDHADLILPAVEGLQLRPRREIQISQAVDGPLHGHQLPALPAEPQGPRPCPRAPWSRRSPSRACSPTSPT